MIQLNTLPMEHRGSLAVSLDDFFKLFHPSCLLVIIAYEGYITYIFWYVSANK